MANEMSSCSPVSRPEMQKRDSVGSDAFSKRDYWHEAASRSFTRVRCMTTAGCVASQVYRDLTTAVKKTNSAPPFVLHENHTTGKSGDDGEERPLPNGTHILAELNLQFEEDMLTYDEDSPEFSSTCSACGRTFEALDLVVVFESDVYHTVCFRCGQCGAIVDASRLFLVLDDGSPLCLECSPACHMCKGKITSNHVGVLNKDFHEGCLKCSQCTKGFSTISKVYASSGEPCCAECITPVFDETWSPRSPSWYMPPLPDISESQITDKKSGPFSTSVGSPRTPHTLPPKLETLSQAVSDLPSLGKYPSLLRPSVSAPSLSNGLQTTNGQMQKLSLSSLEAILYDELGVSLFMNFCVEDCSIEMVVFWLDVEHFKHFDGDMDDMRLFAHHIMLKYIGYYAELPLGLPKSMEDQIIQDMQKENLSQDIFNVAQQHVYNKMEQKVQPRFLKSQDGRNYLEALVTRDIDRRQKKREATIQAMNHVKATVTNFDKRHLNTKFYIYEIMVEMEDSKFMIYRRYSDFHTLHHDLKTFCPSELFPPIPKKIYFGRSQTRTVAQQRMKELEGYLQGVLAMPPAVSRGPILMQFLAQTPVDKEDEAFTMRVMESQRLEGQFSS